MKGKVYIVILNYNGWEDTIECLESLLKSDYDNYQVIIVDNKSTNNSMDYIIKWAEGYIHATCANDSLKEFSCPQISKPIDYDFFYGEDFLSNKEMSNKKLIFIQSNENGGFAKGNNLAIKYAINQDDFEYIWLLNNDTVIKKNTLSNLIDYAIKNKLGITGSALYYYQEPQKIQAYGGKINKFFGTSSHIKDERYIFTDLDYIVGASFLINKNVIKEIGLLPEEYFLYYEETDYCFNARKNGFSLGIALNSVVYHKEGGSTGMNSERKDKSEFCDVLTLKNRIKFHRKYLGGGFGLWMGLLISFLNRIKRNQILRIYKVLKD